MAKNMPCPICGAASLPKPYYRAHHWLVLRCSRCTFAWVADLSKMPESMSFDWGEDVVQESQKRLQMYQDRLRRIEKHAPFPRTWLDVGCGGGGMLKCVAGAGFVAEGIEPSPAADYIAMRLGLSVQKKILSESLGGLRLAEYGVVSYFHVLEHVPDPAPELMTVRQLLADRGLLVIEVPFFDSLAWKLLGSRHRHFYRAHRSYFNLKSISELLTSTGYSIVRRERVPYWTTVDWLLMRMGSKFSILRHFLPPNLGGRMIRIDLGDILMVLAKKNKR